MRPGREHSIAVPGLGWSFLAHSVSDLIMEGHASWPEFPLFGAVKGNGGGIACQTESISETASRDCSL